MKKIIYISLIFPILGLSQSRLVLNNDAYINIENNAYLVIDNANSNALTTSGTGGNILSESETDVVQWNIGNQTGTYTVPFTTKTTKTKIPQTTTITNAGSGDGSILFSTYETATDNNTAYPSDVTNMYSAIEGGDGSLFAVDRFWRVDAGSYTTKPDVSMSFTYDDAANEIGGSNTITEANLQAQQFNSNSNQWNNLEGTANTTSNTVSPVVMLGTDLFQTWTLVDNSTPLPVEFLKLKANRESKQEVHLQWDKVGLKDCQEIVIERRLEGEEELKVIAKVECDEFEFHDENAVNKRSYYRIKVKEEGREIMSEVKVVKGNEEEMVLKLYPNPTLSSSILEIGKDYENLVFTVYDSKGSIVRQKNYQNSMRLIQLGFMVNEPDGIYMVNVNVDDEIQQLKLIKSK